MSTSSSVTIKPEAFFHPQPQPHAQPQPHYAQPQHRRSYETTHSNISAISPTDQSTVRTNPWQREASYDSNGSGGSGGFPEDEMEGEKLRREMGGMDMREAEEELEEELDDRSMLDSVVLPAIASVSQAPCFFFFRKFINAVYSLFPAFQR